MTHTRRGFLAVAVAAAAAASLPAAGMLKRLLGDEAAAAPGGRLVDRFTERGRTVEVFDLAGTQVLRLNGRIEGQHVFAHLGGGRYSSHHFPFLGPQSLRGLVRQLVEGEDQRLFTL
jgi:hypothetical protein